MGSNPWTPDSWRAKNASQQPIWPDLVELERVHKYLTAVPPLVFAGEARSLTKALGAASKGKAFVLQAGDCAESFSDFSADSIRDKLKVILQMAVVLTYSSGVPVVKIGRIAGQFAKPRSLPTEEVDGATIEAFRGFIVNDEAPTAKARQPDPSRMITAYNQSASTLNLLRAFTKGGFADLAQVHTWNQLFVASSKEGRRYESIADEIDRALRFMRACGIDITTEESLHEVDFFTSHEALILPYEEALTRKDSLTDQYYDCSAHMLWCGERTRQLDGAHIEFLSGIKNPIGCKIGPNITSDELLSLCELLDPDRTPGRLTLISRMGASKIADVLPRLVKTTQDSGHPVLWVCDPMHGNTFLADNGRKTRHFDDIISEVDSFFSIHRKLGSWPGGIHIELTGVDVTECLGGTEEVLQDHLDLRYETACDPRLNAKQSLDLAFEVANLLRKGIRRTEVAR
jgi:3-deoxy-7-phosphoheptulonate synthase